MRTTSLLSRISVSFALYSAFALGPVTVEAADDPVSNAARAIGGIFNKKQQPANGGPTQADGSEKTLEQAQQEDRAKGAAAGVAVGAATGAIVHEDDRTKGAIVGGAAGGVIGAVVGDQMAKKRGDYAARYNEIDQAIAAAGQKIQTLQSDTARIERRITLRQTQVKAAQARTASNQAATTAHKQTLAEVEADLKANDSASQSAMVALKVLEDEIKTIEPQVKSDAELAGRKTQLEAKRNELLAVLQKINNADTTLVAQRDTLNGQARS